MIGLLAPALSVATVRQAIADVIDAGDIVRGHRFLWLFWNDESEAQTEMRARFLEAVTARIAELRRLASQKGE